MTSLNHPDDILAFLRKHPKLIFADDFEVAVQHESSLVRSYLEGKSSQRESFEGFWVGVRLLHRKRPGWAVTTDCSPNGLRAVVEQALQSAEQSSMDPWFRFPLWKPHPTSGVLAENGQYDSLAPHLSSMPIGLSERYQVRALQTLLARKSEKCELRSFQNAHEAAISILSTSGEEPARIEEIWSHPGNVSDRGKRLERLSKSAALHAVLDKRRSVISDARDLVLAPHVARDWVLGVGRSMSASLALRPGTFWDVLGTKPVSSALTLSDDGKSADVPYATAFDLEGSLTQKTLLIDKGERRSFLHDCYSAARENRISTGNYQRRDGEMDPGTHPWRLVVEPGESPEPWKQSSLVAFIDEVHPVPGARGREPLYWDRMLSGLLMRRGEPVARIRPFQVSWSFSEMLQGITAMDNSSQMFGNVSCPSIWWEKMPKQTKEAP